MADQDEAVPTASTRVATRTGTAMVLLGVAVTLGGLRLDGFVRGFLEGAGIVLILAGVYWLSAEWRSRRRGDRRGPNWLPSRDDRA